MYFFKNWINIINGKNNSLVKIAYDIEYKMCKKITFFFKLNNVFKIIIL